MATKTFDELIAGATVIKNNELPESNTHTLVGGQLLEMANKHKESDQQSDVINVTTKFPLAAGSYYTSSTARSAVTAEYRKLGKKLLYQTDATTWVEEKFIGSAITDAIWNAAANWLGVASKNDINQLGADLNQTNLDVKRISGGIGGIMPVSIYSLTGDSLLLTANGGIINSQYTLGFGVSDYIAVTPMQYITILNGLVQAPSLSTCYVSFYSDNNGTFVSSISEGDGVTTKDIYNKLIQVPATATYMRLSLKNKNHPAFFITSKDSLTLLNETKNEFLDLITHNSIISDAVSGNDLTKYAKNGYYMPDGKWVAEGTAKTILINSLVPILRLKLDNITSFAANSVVLKLVDPDTLAEIKTVQVSDLTSLGSNNYYYDLITDAQRRYGVIIQYGVSNLSSLKVYLTNPHAKKVIDLSTTVSSFSNSIAKNENNLSRIATFSGAEILGWVNYTENGYWSIVDSVAALKVGYNYFSTILKTINPGTVIHFSGLSYEGTLWKAAQIMYLYDNEKASIIGKITPQNLTIDAQGNADYIVPAGVGYIGFSWSTDYPMPNLSFVIGEDDFTLTPKMENRITGIASEVGGGSSVDTANYYLKGNVEKTTNTKKLCIIAGGQSNMNGAIPIAELPPSIVLPMPNCHYNYRNHGTTTGSFIELTQSALSNNNWGVDLPLYDKLCKSDGREIYVMKTSFGGVGIDPQGATGNLCWTADYEKIPIANSLIRVFENQIRELTTSDGSNFDIKAFIWHQGEGDSVTPVSSRYYDNLRKVISYIRGVTGKPALPFIFGTISHNSAQYSAIVEDAMLKIAAEDVNVYLVDMSRAVLRDAYHFNAAWAVYLGQKIYDCLIDCGAITGTKINPSEPA